MLRGVESRRASCNNFLCAGVGLRSTERGASKPVACAPSREGLFGTLRAGRKKISCVERGSFLAMRTASKAAAMALWAGGLATLIRLAKAMPYLPGDVSLARAIQALLPYGPWAEFVTRSAEPPASIVLLFATVALAYLIAGEHAAAFSIPVFFGLFFFYVWASPYVAQPRPSPSLIHVVGNPSGFAFPSIFALVYVATFGYLAVLAALALPRPWRIVIPALLGLWLAVGAAARVVMGAHWPSDLLLSYLAGFFWIFLLMPLVALRRRFSGHEPKSGGEGHKASGA